MRGDLVNYDGSLSTTVRSYKIQGGGNQAQTSLSFVGITLGDTMAHGPALKGVMESIRRDMRDHPFTRRIVSQESSTIPVNVRSIRTRVAIFGEPDSLPHLNWIHLAFPNSVTTLISETYIAEITPSRCDFDLLVVAGKDASRLKRLFRLYKPVLVTKPTIAVMDTATPNERAALLNCGYDDVCDPRTPVPVAQARASALVRRYEIVASQSRSTDDVRTLESILNKDCPQTMTARQIRILKKLVERSPEPVAVDVLRSLEGLYKVVTRSTLKVLISQLRGVIGEEYEIVYVTPSYYALITCVKEF